MDSTYCYPDTNVLINKFGLKNALELNDVEKDIPRFRLLKLQTDPIQGNFNLSHLQAIHRYMFQDVYDWAGEIRNVNISKGGTFFCNPLYIKSYSDTIFNSLAKDRYLKNLSPEVFCSKLAHYASDINALHPFREGNGRSTREFLRCLSKEAGYILDYSKVPPMELFNAFVESNTNDQMLIEVFKRIIIF